MIRTRTWLGVIAIVGTGASVVGAQQPASAVGAWRIEPSAGIWRHVDHTPDGSVVRELRHVGPSFGLTVSRQRGAIVRLTASAGYYRLDDADEIQQMTPSGQPRTDVYDAEILSVTAGAVRDLWQRGASAFGLGIEVGAGWKRYRLDRSSGPSTSPFLPQTLGGDWGAVFLMVPSLGVRRAVSSRVELTLTGRMPLAVGDMEPNNVPAIVLGTAYRF